MSEKLLHLILEEMKGFKTELQSMRQEMNGFKTEQQSMKQDFNTLKSQVEENTQLVKAVIHRQVESDSLLNNLTLNLAKLHEEVVLLREDVTHLVENQISTNELLAEHDLSIRTLRRKLG